MFKCSECGTEYETSPKYCDCGNDIFINIEDTIPQEVEDIDFEPQKPQRRNRNIQKKFSLSAIIIFSSCIILSLLILFVIGNPKKQEKQITKSSSEKISIPSVDSYWDNTSVKTEQEEIKKENPILDMMPKIVQEIIPQEEPKKELNIPVAPTNKTTTPLVKTTPKSQPKSVTSQNKIPNTTSKPSTNTSQSQTGMTFEDLTNKIRNQYYTNQNTTAQIPTQTTQIPSKTTTQTPKTTSHSTAQTTNHKNTTINTPSQTQPQPTKTDNQIVTTPVPEKPAKTQAQIRQELNTYKANLRNLIGKKIDFTKVIGDGECSLSFKINSNGRLTSKAFTKQSSNITLNDAAFNALNTTTSYNPPPEGYNGETLKLIIKFYNGNFEISLN